MRDGTRSAHPNALPNYQNAIIPRDKLERYLLNPAHPEGKHKGIVFKSALGFEQSDWKMLRDSIADGLPYHETLLGRTDKYGTRYNVTMPITGANGRTVDVLTAWIVATGNEYPSFVTALVI